MNNILRLNEGFATVFEYHLTGMLYPEWRVVDLFNTRTLQNVFRNDARVQTRPMTKPLLTPEEISAAFDYVVYAKGKKLIISFKLDQLQSRYFSGKCSPYVPIHCRGRHLQSIPQTLCGNKVSINSNGKCFVY